MKLSEGQAFNAIAFVLENKLLNENGLPLEFDKHRFLIKPFTDNTPQQVVMKASQVGWSTLAIIRALHLAKYAGANIIYSLPSKNIVRDFVKPKVDALIDANPALAKMMGATDSITLKQVEDRFIYFRSSYDPTTAISISAHILINDEVDRSNQEFLRVLRSRLDAAKLERPELGWEWRFSNPSIPGAGVDEWWQKSDQKHWFVKCSNGHEWYMSYPESINFDTDQYICSKCQIPLTEEQRIKGRWVNKKKSHISGYWINQMMCVWHSAHDIIEKSKEEPSVFYNFTLGLPYISQDQSVSREAIVKCISPDVNPRTDVAIGVDNGVVKTYVVGNRYGIFKVGETESWEEIENLRNRYNASMVIDMMPYPNTPKKLIEKYRGKVYGHYFGEDKKEHRILRWGEKEKRGIVYSDRLRMIDTVVADIHAGDVTFNLTLADLEQYIYDWGQLYRVVEESVRGIMTPSWKTIEGRRDHFAFATVYWRIALEKTLNTGEVLRPEKEKEADWLFVNPDKTTHAYNLDKAVAKLNEKHKSWKTR